MPPGDERLLLLQLHALLGQAIAERDWTRIERIDLAIRSCLHSLPAVHTLSAEVRQARHQLKQLHGVAMAASLEEGERLRQILDQHLEQAEGLNAYRAIDLYRDEE